MRVLAVADLHYRLRHYDWLVDRRRATSTSWRSPATWPTWPARCPSTCRSSCSTTTSDGSPSRPSCWPRRATTTWTGPASTASRWPAGCAGRGPAHVHTDRTSVDVGDTRFTVCPWWDGPASREVVGRQLAAAAVDRPARWVWVYHSPPAGTVLCRDGRREFPDHDLAGWIDRAPARRRAVRAHPPGALGRRRLVARAARDARW